MDRQVPVYSMVRSPGPSDSARPVLAAMIGVRRRPAAVITRVLGGLGDNAVVFSVHRAMPIEDLRIAHKEVGEHLAGGDSVLVNGATSTKRDRRTLWDIASRHRAATLAVIRPADPDHTAVAEIASEGWHAVVVAP